MTDRAPTSLLPLLQRLEEAPETTAAGAILADVEVCALGRILGELHALTRPGAAVRVADFAAAWAREAGP